MKKAAILVALMVVSAVSVFAIPPKAVEDEDHPGLMGFMTGNGGFQVWGDGVHYVVKKENNGRNNEKWMPHPGDSDLVIKANEFGPEDEEPPGDEPA